MSSTDRKIFVGGLDYETVEETVEQYFGQWGPVAECSVKRFPDGKSRGFGFVTFSSLAAMENCFDNQPHMIDDKKVDLRKAAESTGPSRGSDLTSKGYDPEARELKKLFVGSLDWATTEEEIEEYFSKYGDISNVAISKFPDSGKSRGFAFVTFISGASVDSVQQSRPHVVKGRKLETKRATPKQLVGKPESQISSTKVFIGPPEIRSKGHSGLSEDISDEDLSEDFGQFGTIVKVQQMRWEDSGKKRGYGYVEFTDDDSVDKIVLVRTHVIKEREIEAKKALTRQQMKEIEEIKNKTGHQSMSNMEMSNMGNSNAGMGMNNFGMGMNNMGMGMGGMGMGGMGMGGMGMGGMGMGGMGMGGMGMNGMGAGSNMGGNRFNMGASNESRGTKRPRTAVDLEAQIMRKLYVGSLDFGATEEDLKAHFEQYGEIEKVNIQKFPDTGRSRGFGFITFQNSSGVDNVQMSRPHQLQGKSLETKRALPKGDNNSVKKIFIGAPEDEKLAGGHSGLSDEIEDEDLNNYFSQFGVVTKIDQLRWKDSGKKRGYGYIEFDDEDTVDKVCLIGIHEVLGVRLEVKKAVEKHALQKSGGPVFNEMDNQGAKRSRKEQIDPESKVMRKIFVGNLSFNTTEDTLKEYFEKFGSTELVQLPLHVDSGKPRGFAFVTFTEASFVDATQSARPHKLDGNLIETTRATPKQDLGNPEAEARVKKIFIGGSSEGKAGGHSGLTEDISDADLETYFGKFGMVTKVEQKIWEDSGKKRGYGYVEFDDEDAVDKIVLLGVHIVKDVRLEAKKGLNKDQIRKVGGGGNFGMKIGRIGSVKTGGDMMVSMHHNKKGDGFMPGHRNSDMGNTLGPMQSMMGSMRSGNMDGGNMMGNMQKMQAMMGNMQNNMGSGGIRQGNNMQMMQNMTNMQNMMGSMQSNNGAQSGQDMTMMTSMQQTMMNMMSMCTQMMNQGMKTNQSSTTNSSTFSGQGNNSQGNGSSSQGMKSSDSHSRGSAAYSSQGGAGFGTQGMSDYSSYGNSDSYTGGDGQSSNMRGQSNNSSSGMGNTTPGNMGHSGMGSSYSSMGNSFTGMGNSSRGGGPVRGGMGASRGNPYSRT